MSADNPQCRGLSLLFLSLSELASITTRTRIEYDSQNSQQQNMDPNIRTTDREEYPSPSSSKNNTHCNT